VRFFVREGFWIKLSKEVKRAEGEAEARMVGVIRESAIGHHPLREERRKSITIKDPEGGNRVLPGEEITTTVREAKPQWQAAAWFLERKYPEKYAQRKIVEGELPKDIPYEVFMTAKLLLQLPKTELQRITSALKQRMCSPRVANVETGPKLIGEGEAAAGRNSTRQDECSLPDPDKAGRKPTSSDKAGRNSTRGTKAGRKPTNKRKGKGTSASKAGRNSTRKGAEEEAEATKTKRRRRRKA
jgi:hypothetical protein